MSESKPPYNGGPRPIEEAPASPTDLEVTNKIDFEEDGPRYWYLADCGTEGVRFIETDHDVEGVEAAMERNSPIRIFRECVNAVITAEEVNPKTREKRMIKQAGFFDYAKRNPFFAAAYKDAPFLMNTGMIKYLQPVDENSEAWKELFREMPWNGSKIQIVRNPIAVPGA